MHARRAGSSFHVAEAIIVVVAIVLSLSAVSRADWPDPATPFPQPAYTAEQFVNFIGISAGPFDHYLADGPFKGAGTKYPPEVFFDLGVRYYRTCLKYDLTPPDAPEKVKAAFEKYGARPMLLISPGKDGSMQDIVNLLKQYGGSDVVAEVEGPNEVNNKFPPQELNLRYGGKHDEAAGSAFMVDLYKAMKADPATRDIPLVNFTAIFTDDRLARPCDAFDFNNTHSYQGQNVPSVSLLSNFVKTNHILPEGAEIKPFIPTECGYNVEEDQTNHIKGNGTLKSQALSIPMLLGEYFRHGYMKRAYLFALQNADGYGLLESDQQTKRPSYYALQSFIAALKDANWNPATKKWEGGDFHPRALLFTVDNAPSTFKEVSLEKHSGEYSLLMWNELPNFNSGTRQDADNPPIPITLHFAAPINAKAQVLRQDDSGAFKAAEELPIQNGTLTVNVPSAVIIVRVTPTDAVESGELAPPTDLQGSATENAVHIAWKSAEAPGITGYFIYRNGWCIASLPATQTSFDDRSPWIRPGLGYRYEVQAHDDQGNLSSRSSAVVQTAKKYPDLVVTGFGLEKPDAEPGDQVRFYAKVRNVGTGATPYGVDVSASFHADSDFFAWSTCDGPLAPGEERTMFANGGPHGPLWTATAGAHVLTAVLDDIDRLPEESDKNNNVADQTFVIGAPSAGELLGSSQAAPWKVNLSAEGTDDWTQWGVKDAQSIDRKAGAHLISDVTKFGPGYLGSTSGFSVRTEWTGGEPIASMDQTNSSLWLNNVGSGYRFTVPADTTERVLKVYCAGIEGAACSFTATLSDNSAAPYVSRAWTGNMGQGSWAAVPGDFTAVYSVRYRAASPGAKLTIEFRLDAEGNRFLGQARLGAATLSQVGNER